MKSLAQVTSERFTLLLALWRKTVWLLPLAFLVARVTKDTSLNHQTEHASARGARPTLFGINGALLWGRLHYGDDELAESHFDIRFLTMMEYVQRKPLAEEVWVTESGIATFNDAGTILRKSALHALLPHSHRPAAPQVKLGT